MKITDSLTITTLLFLTFALNEIKSQPFPVENDIVIVIDFSSSMLSEDLTPNRLEVGKEALIEFIEGSEKSQLGLVVFAGEAQTRCALTKDKELVKDFITYSKCGVLAGGTKIETGLLTAIDNLKSSSSKKKLIVLLTDGMNNLENLDFSIITKAKEQKIKVYAICLGSWNIGVRTIGVNSDGKPVLGITDAAIPEDFFTNITQKTGGRFFRATNTRDLKSIFVEINKLERFTKK